MDVGTGVGIVGIVATILLGVWGAKKIVKKRQIQRQSVRGGVAIQSGRDTKIGDKN